MVLDIHDNCADPSPRFTDTVRRENRRHEAQQIFKGRGAYNPGIQSLYMYRVTGGWYGQKVCPGYLYESVEWRKPVIPY